MTFDRQQLEIVRRLLRTELKRAQGRVERLPLDPSIIGRNKLDAACAYRDRVEGMLQEALAPVMVTRRNLMSGQEYQEAEDTPLSCSPASETYWSM